MTFLKRLREALAQQKEGKLAEAEEVYLNLISEYPENADASHLLGLIRSSQDRDEEAILLISKAIAISPNASAFHHNIAGIYRRQGSLATAEKEFRRAIELKADYGEAFQGLAEMVKFTRGDPLAEKILTQLNSSELDSTIKTYFHFAAGKYFDDIGDYREAFQHYAAGNKSAEKEFDSRAFHELMKNCLYQFSPANVDKVGAGGSDSEQPVFVVGMPRSGTTLVEQILASHSAVFGAGELNDMKYIAQFGSQFINPVQKYPDFFPFLGPQHYQRLAQDYLSRTNKLLEPDSSRNIQRVVDKHPLNFQFVGLIFAMFPNAKVINTVRHPLDNCLSCFFQNFSSGQHYSFDLGALTNFYLGYRRLMAHWEMLYPGKIYSIQYEDLVSDQEVQTRRLLDYCGLEFESACLKFHETDRVVKTASFNQVRKPIYRTSQNRWKNYSQELMPVAKAMGLPVQTPVTITSSNILGQR
ncbi:MAG: tetratricopeptide (TPR) repeat protein [Candidatus Azotimanducaceae bacterium]